MDLPFVCRSFPLPCVGDSNGRVRGKQREAALTLLIPHLPKKHVARMWHMYAIPWRNSLTLRHFGRCFF